MRLAALMPLQPLRKTDISSIFERRKMAAGRLTETWGIMWRGAKAWALIIQVKEQHKIAPFVANIIPFHNSEWLRGIWTSTSAL